MTLFYQMIDKMGGNLIPNAKRMPLEDYNRIKTEIADTLLKNGIDSNFLIDVPGKMDFGDIDILVSELHENIYSTHENFLRVFMKTLKDTIIKCFNPKIINTSNAGILTFGYTSHENVYQIDLILCEREYIDSNIFYFSYGDVGSIIGRITNYYGIKLGNYGLWVCVIKNTLENTLGNAPGKDSDSIVDLTRQIGRIHLSKNPRDICNYLGLDFSQWGKFRTPEEIYDWIKSCRFYSKEIFQLLNRPHMDRYKKRKFYTNFIQYIFGDSIVPKSPLTSETKGEFMINKQFDALVFFNKTDELETLKQNRILTRKRHEKFNGKIFLDLFKEMQQEPPRELRRVILSFVESITKKPEMDENWLGWLDATDAKIIHERIGDFLHKKFQ